jgi:hypothetical protein
MNANSETKPVDLKGADIAELFARMTPPSRPAEALALSTGLSDLVADLDPLKAVAALTGMMTEPRFQAHTVRLDYCLRLILAAAHGNRRLGHRELNKLLNDLLVEARVERLEDPIEDFLTEAIPTRRGDYLIFSGIWEKAAIHTECMLRGFEALPEWEGKQPSLNTLYRLLVLGDALAHRCGLARRVVGNGTPAGAILTPSDERLRILSQRVRFTWADLATLGIDKDALKPFCLSARAALSLTGCTPGDSALEFMPLIRTETGLLIAAPANISTAARAWLIDTAIAAGQRGALRNHLLEEQTELVRHSGFVRVRDMEHIPATPPSMRQSLYETSSGRYIHLIQTIDDFPDWPARAFGESKPYSAEWVEAIIGSMRSAKRFAEQQAGFVEGMTLWLIGGWGSGYNASFERDQELEGWLLVPVEPADAALLGISEDRSVHDVWRLQKQLLLVEAQGFEFFGVNGLLNLFQWWRKTEYALVPPHMIDMTPPLTINFDTNLLLQVRQSGQEPVDRRTAQHPDGTHHLIARLNHQVLVGNFDPIYASIDTIRDGCLLGIVIVANSAWWVELTDDGRQPYSKTAFRIWEAILNWVSVVMPPFLATLKLKGALPAIAFNLEIRWDDIERPRNLTDNEIAQSVEVALDPERKCVKLTLRSAWHWALRRTDNVAEILLATRLLVGATLLYGVERSEAELGELVREAAGSPDLRWIHSFEARTALEGLVASDLIRGLHPIPKSAVGLAKFGAVWNSRPRESRKPHYWQEVVLRVSNGSQQKSTQQTAG